MCLTQQQPEKPCSCILHSLCYSRHLRQSFNNPTLPFHSLLLQVSSAEQCPLIPSQHPIKFVHVTRRFAASKRRASLQHCKQPLQWLHCRLQKRLEQLNGRQGASGRLLKQEEAIAAWLLPNPAVSGTDLSKRPQGVPLQLLLAALRHSDAFRNKSEWLQPVLVLAPPHSARLISLICRSGRFQPVAKNN